jgi:hypothetical protein
VTIVNTFNNLIVFSDFFSRFNINNNDHVLDDPLNDYEQAIINEICPNPDAMTYEQLMELQDKVGFVDKGLNKTKIQVNQKNLIYSLSLL